MMQPILSARNLSKSFKENKVLKGIGFDVGQGEVLCLLGPNGAGKTTTINILTAALRADSGEIRFLGEPIAKNLRAYKQRLGIVPQEIALYEELSAERNVRFFASLYGLSGAALCRATDEALAFAGLTDRRRDKVKTFSGGMKRRLNIACAIAHKPALVIMDEPTVGIDPQSRSHILGSIKTLRDEGMTVLYTTHYMEEVEAISTRILIMDHGAIIAEGTKESLKEEFENEKRYIIEIEENGRLELAALYAVEGVKAAKLTGNTLTVTSVRGVENLDKLIALLSDHNERIRSIASESASLETVFLKLTGRKLRD